MAKCSECGGDIIFRYKDGQVVPIHLSGSCHGVYSEYAYRSREDGFCRLVKCHYCDLQVFFVRHNGGSVLFDDLGKPWPKHNCSGYSRLDALGQYIDKTIKNWVNALPDSMIGVVVETYTINSLKKKLIVKCPDDSELEIRISCALAINEFMHDLVIFSPTAKKLFRPYTNTKTEYEIEIQHGNIYKSPEDQQRLALLQTPDQYLRCPVCKVFVHRSQLMKHCNLRTAKKQSKHHPKGKDNVQARETITDRTTSLRLVKCPICNVQVREDHLVRHKRKVHP